MGRRREEEMVLSVGEEENTIEGEELGSNAPNMSHLESAKALELAKAEMSWCQDREKIMTILQRPLK
jgi:hypothetical protein